MAIDGPDQIEVLRQVIQGGRCGEVRQDDLLWLGRLRGSAHSHGNIFGLAEVLLPDDFGFAVDAPAFACVPVGATADDLFDYVPTISGYFLMDAKETC